MLDEATPEDIRSLAYIGDAVCHLFIRQWLVGRGGDVRGLARRAAAYASAPGQARAAEALMPLLTEDEADVFRRGRNAKCGVVPKNCAPVDYRKATGFEALMGWLYFFGRRERLEELLVTAYGVKGPSDGDA
jgi:ribonuclease-3 family protein